MVIVKLMGGLGNQMFQYATGRRLSYRLNTELKLDTTAFETNPLRKYNLQDLNIQEQFATSREIHSFFKEGGAWYLAFLQQLGLHRKFTVLKENLHLSFVPEVLEVTGHVYLDGYWQSEKYFSDLSHFINNEFTVMSPIDEGNQESLDRICRTNSVCVHVRRGDYVTNLQTNKIHGTCPVEYYLKGMEIITKKVPNPQYFVFSDDPEWVRQNINSDKSSITYMGYNSPDNVHEDLRLMSFCKHFIIANSSLSWWGAWLSKNPDKIVLAPQKWLSDTSYDRKDLVPTSWEKI